MVEVYEEGSCMSREISPQNIGCIAYEHYESISGRCLFKSMHTVYERAVIAI